MLSSGPVLKINPASSKKANLDSPGRRSLWRRDGVADRPSNQHVPQEGLASIARPQDLHSLQGHQPALEIGRDVPATACHPVLDGTEDVF